MTRVRSRGRYVLVQIVATASVSNQGVMKVPKRVLAEMELTGGGNLVFVKDANSGFRILSGDSRLVLKEP